MVEHVQRCELFFGDAHDTEARLLKPRGRASARCVENFGSAHVRPPVRSYEHVHNLCADAPEYRFCCVRVVAATCGSMRVQEPWERRADGARNHAAAPMLGFMYWAELDSLCTIVVVLGVGYLVLSMLWQFANPHIEREPEYPPPGGHIGYGYGPRADPVGQGYGYGHGYGYGQGYGYGYGHLR
eukprot:SAG31_NODE_270_length_18732_cov_9.342618_5_plen_184_part_00